MLNQTSVTEESVKQFDASLSPQTMTSPSNPQTSQQIKQQAHHQANQQSNQEQQYRASAYSILAALLSQVPETEVLKHVANFSQVAVDEDELLLAMSTLGLAAKSSDQSAIDDEYHDLFIGLGRGELVPYGSWYLTGFLMERPLSILRDDLKALGFERDEDVVEPEDHVAALCEVMSLLVTDGISNDDASSNDKSNAETQIIFFEKHINPWMDRFFNDLSEADSAVFYRAVGRFGSAFLNLEKQYLLA